MVLDRDSIIIHKKVIDCCFVCGTTKYLTAAGTKIMCYGCEHEMFYADRDMELMYLMYGYE